MNPAKQSADRLSEVKVSFPQFNTQVVAGIGDNLLELMRLHNLPINADCGGIGCCNKCHVSINDDEEQLACLTTIIEESVVYVAEWSKDNATNVILNGEREIVIIDSHRSDSDSSQMRQDKVELDTASLDVASVCRTFAIAIDLGTTTVVGKLLDLQSGHELASFARLNAQRSYGADIMSRIEAASDDASTLSKLIREQIDTAAKYMLDKAEVNSSAVKKVVVAGNTAMTYILLGLPCRSLGAAPFIPEFALDQAYPYEQVFNSDTLSCDCIVFPYMSAFVGGDLSAGLCALAHEDDFILMDLGTNGEMVYKRDGELICTATAAGPAFEGAAIECGSGSTVGAISSVCIADGQLEIKTIGNGTASGICGCGILDTMAMLIDEGFVDQAGTFRDASDIDANNSLALLRKNDRIILYPGSPLNNYREVYFSQNDVRQFQLAKSAVRAGLEIIIGEMGGRLPAKVFLAGGFGQNLSAKSAITTGLIPKELAGRIVTVGNSSLNGAAKICFDNESYNTVSWLANQAREINLATHHEFADLFMEHMYF